MLKVYFFEDDKIEISHADMWFKLNYRDAWFNDDFVKAMVLSVDKSEVMAPRLIVSPVLGAISPNDLSTGVKNLIIAYETDKVINASLCGDNCAEWLLRISERKDLTIVLNHPMSFKRDFEGLIMNTGLRTRQIGVFNDAMLEIMDNIVPPPDRR